MDFRKKVIENKMCDWISLQLLSDTFLILRVRRIQSDIINMHRFIILVRLS